MPILAILIVIAVSCFYIHKSYQEQELLKRSLKKYDSLISQEKYQRKLTEDISLKRSEIFELSEEYESILGRYSKIKDFYSLENKLKEDISK